MPYSNSNSYFKLFLGFYIHPISTLRQIKESPRKFHYAFYTILIFSALAMTNMMCYHLGGLIAEPEPWLRYPIEQTWIYSFFLMIPTALLGAIIFAGISQLFARLFKGQGNFESQFALYLFSFPPYFILLHIVKFIYFIFFNLSLAGPALFIIMGLVFIMMLLSVKIEHRMKWGPTVLITLIGYTIGALFSLTYIR